MMTLALFEQPYWVAMDTYLNVILTLNNSDQISSKLPNQLINGLQYTASTINSTKPTQL